MGRESYQKWQRPTYDFCRNLVMGMVDTALKKHGWYSRAILCDSRVFLYIHLHTPFAAAHFALGAPDGLLALSQPVSTSRLPVHNIYPRIHTWLLTLLIPSFSLVSTALHLPARAEDVRDFSDELTQARQEQVVWSIYTDIQKQIIFDLLSEVAEEVYSICTHASSTVEDLLVEAIQVGGGQLL